jgi:hypothetical protein
MSTATAAAVAAVPARFDKRIDCFLRLRGDLASNAIPPLASPYVRCTILPVTLPKLDPCSISSRQLVERVSEAL